ncbi:cation-translocating P-type ATPase [Candidatus Nanohalobium constans]|uniref:Ca2+/Mg2+-transporting ATPase n=1 Tax=Candidatus Nanohalobium constans TaxID=2565781 RepID=A0A5Q0UI30_9ARCH|nr:cation-transporting P-type ATPase [Candidatus Nanohalobium constans]QGA80585.1 Ca2+/Mg2+-transporting ATPase [Candidatus Nanohalobium constans]
MSWHSDTKEEVFSNLDTTEDGLSSDETEDRLKEYGENRIEDNDSTSMLDIFISQFQDNLIYLLMAAGLLTVLVGFLPGHEANLTETAIIFAILFANGIFGFIQDYRAEKSIEALKEMSTPNTTVLRDGKKLELDSTKVVPGDIVFLEQGDAVPADGRILEAESLSTDESALTGESQNISKSPGTVEEDSPIAERTNMAFKNTHVVKGRGKMIVTDTGMDTEVGNIAEEIEEAEQGQTPFQEEVDALGKRIGYLVVGIVAVVALIQAFLTGAGPMTVLLLAIGLSVAAIPESLPAIVTLTLSLGSKKLLKKDALVRRLPVVEALGSVDHIVTDKTGTLTEGTMTVEKLYFQEEEFDVTGKGTSKEGIFMRDGHETDSEYLKPLLECGMICNNAEEAEADPDLDFRGEPTEVALLVSAMKAGLENDKERKRAIPFSSDRKRMTVVTEDDNAYMKGAPETVLDRCNRILIDGEEKELTEEKKQELLDKNDRFAKDALRVLGFARKEVSEPEADEEEIESDMVFLGLQGMIDPAREEVEGAVEDCRTAGIGVVMATGDNIETAKAIGKELGFDPEGALTGQEIEEMSEEELEDKVTEVEIFARVSPEHKVKISKALQNQGYNVAMTGDGVNDAPALKNSDVGIAMGQRGTDVAKKSSDMVLQDDNFVTIRDAISEGRHIFDNIRKVTNQLLSTNSGEVMFVFLGTLIGGFLFPEQFNTSESVVLTAVMILWVNFASDGPPAIALGEDPKVKGIMERPPRGRDEPIIDKKILSMIAFTGPVAALICLPLFFMNIGNFVMAQTMLFMALAFFELLMFPIIRRDYGLNLSDNKYLVAMIGLSIASHLAVLYTPLADLFNVVPLTLQQWGYIAASLGVFVIVEVLFRRMLSRKYGDRIGDFKEFHG